MNPYTSCCAVSAPEKTKEEKESLWSTILKVILAVATALAGAFGLQSCI